MEALTPSKAYRRELSTTARPYLFGLVATAVVVGTLVGTMLYVAFSEGGSSDLKQGMLNASLIAILPIILGVRIAHQNFIFDHGQTITALRNLGVAQSFFRRQLIYQAIGLAVIASVSAVIIGRVIVRPFLNALFIGMDKRLPDSWGSPVNVVISALVALSVIYLIGVGSIRLERVLERESSPSLNRGGGRKLFRLVAVLVVMLNIMTGCLALTRGVSSTGVFILVATTPVVAAFLAPPMSKLASQLISEAGRRISGWGRATTGIRSIVDTGTISRAGLAAALVGIPLAGFTWVSASLAAGSYYAEQAVNDVPVVVSREERLVPPADAERTCHELSEACVGVIYWQPSDFINSGLESVPLDVANDYTVAGSTPDALRAFFAASPTTEPDNPFHLDYMRIAAAVSETPPVAPEWALVVLREEAEVSSDHTVISAKRWASRAHDDTQLFYGPSGDGTAGFIPLAAYTILSVCMVLVVATAGKRSSLQEFFSPLRRLGRTKRDVQFTAFWATLFPYLCALLAAVVACFWYTVVAYAATTGHLGSFVPSMPGGLWLLFASVFLITSVAASYPVRRGQSER